MGNPFLDPKRDIVQGKTDADILTAYEKRLAEAAEDAAAHGPGVGLEEAYLEELKKVRNPVYMGEVRREVRNPVYMPSRYKESSSSGVGSGPH